MTHLRTHLRTLTTPLRARILMWHQRLQERRRRNRAIAMAVYLTWSEGLLGAPLPGVEVQRWCNQWLGRKVFPEVAPDAQGHEETEGER